jgi:Ca-activated chloride channel family protein
MTFAQPWFLLGFALFAPVILLYLLKQRRRRVEVSTLMFWDKILRDEQTVTSLTRLKKLLSLLLQLLFIALLTLAASRPSLSGKLTGARRIVLLLDNSASMLVQEGGKTRFDIARERAQGVVRGMSIGDSLMLVAVAAEADILHPFTDSKKDLQEAIDNLQPTHGGTDFKKAIALVEQLPADDRETHIYLVTDGAFDPVEIHPLDRTRFAYLRVGAKSDNVGISTFSVRPLPSSPRDFQVHLEITNDSEKDRRVPVELRIGGRLVDAFEFDVPAGKSLTRTLRQFSAQGGEIEAFADVKDTFPLDNRAYATLPRPRPIRVCLVTPENLFLQSALATDEDVELEVVKPDKFTESSTHAVTIFSGWRPPATPPGNSIFIGDWPDDLGLKKRGELSKPLFTEWQRDHPVNRHLALQNVAIEKAIGVEPNAAWQKLAASFNEPLVLLRETPERYTLVITFDTSTTDLPLRIAFPILVANAIRHLAGAETGERWVNPQMGSLLTSSEVTKLAAASSAETNTMLRAVLAPDGARIPLEATGGLVPVSRAGFYRAETSSGETNALFAANLSSPRECRIQPGETLPLRSSKPIAEIKEGFRLGFEPWMMLALLAAVLSVTEWVLFHRRVIE